VASADPAVRARILDVLTVRGTPGVEVVRETTDGEHALLACSTEHADGAILDESLPGMSGSSVAHVLRDMGRELDIVVVYGGAEQPEDEPDALSLSDPQFDAKLRRGLGIGDAAAGPPAVDAVRLFVVDDHEMVRRGLRDLANEYDEIKLVGEWDKATGAVEEIERVRPDVAVLDLRLPDGDGVELCREIRSRVPTVRCLMFTAYADEEALLRSIMAGASGYLLKHGSTDDLVDGIKAVAMGASLIDPTTAESLLEFLRQGHGGEGIKLSVQQERVLDLIVDGLTNREIGERLNLAEKTVKNYVSTILEKLQVRSRTQAAVYGAKLRRQSHPPDSA
jgi:DNA-binding NarL/FixJ family response regulator